MADITSNLDLWWSFADGSGTSSADASGNSRTGTLNNSPTWATGRIGGCLSFNGSNSNVSRASYATPANGSLAFWWKPARAYNSGVNEVLFIIGGVSNLLHANHWTDNHLYVGFFNGGDTRINITLDAAKWAQSTWQHYCLTWVSGGATTLYRNGLSIGANGGSTSSTLSADTLRVGTQESQANGFSGDIQDFRIYSRTLSAADAASLAAYPVSFAWFAPNRCSIGEVS